MSRMKFYAKTACLISVVSLIVVGFVKYKLPDTSPSLNANVYPAPSFDIPRDFARSLSSLERKVIEKPTKTDEENTNGDRLNNFITRFRFFKSNSVLF